MARGNFGERLKRERELREVTLDEITQATRIGPRFLEAFENEEWEKLPGGVFNRGFVRSIARYLGLDEEGFLAEYDLAHAPHVQQQQIQKEEQRIPTPPRWIPVALVLGILALVLGMVWGGIYGWRKYVQKRAKAAETSVVQPANSGATTGVTTSSGAPAAASVVPDVTKPAEEELTLIVSTGAATHVRVDGDGGTLLEMDLPKGETRRFSAKSQFVVTAADSSAVLLELNGEAMPPLGAPGSSGTMTLTRNNLRRQTSGNSQP